MKKMLITLSIVAACLTACKKEIKEIPTPELDNIMIGSNNSKKAVTNSKLSIISKITAAGGDMKIEIYPKSGKGWNFSQEYKEEFANLKSVDFHKDIHVPADAAEGEYRIRLTVTDQHKRNEIFESDLTVVPGSADIEDDDYVTNDGELNVTAKVYTDREIAKIIVEIYNSSWSKQYEFKDDDIVGKFEYDFDKTIDITDLPGQIPYDVSIKVIDQSGEEYVKEISKEIE